MPTTKREVLLEAVIWFMETDDIPSHLAPLLEEHGITLKQVKETISGYLEGSESE